MANLIYDTVIEGDKARIYGCKFKLPNGQWVASESLFMHIRYSGLEYEHFRGPADPMQRLRSSIEVDVEVFHAIENWLRSAEVIDGIIVGMYGLKLHEYLHKMFDTKINK